MTRLHVADQPPTEGNMNQFSRRIFAYAMVVLTSCAHFQGATPLPGSDAPGQVGSLSPMQWNIAHSQREFFKKYAYNNEVIVALFAAESCAPCHAAKEWWEKNGTPRVVPFVFWEDKNVTNEKFEPYRAGKVGMGMYAATHPDKHEEAYPFCAIVEGAYDKAPFTRVVKWSGRSYEECTVGLQQALANLR